MLGIGHTPFDLRLMAFRIPIRVHPTFWVMAALLEWDPENLRIMFIWILCVFVSVLIHELGHAFTAEAFGWPTEIVLYYAGGVAVSDRYLNNSPSRSLAVSFMGPAAGFMLYGLVVCVEVLLRRYGFLRVPYVFAIVFFLKQINLWWGVLNLLPILPLDGGHITHSLLQIIRVRDAESLAMKVSAVVAGAAAYYFFEREKNQFMGIMMLMFCVQNVTAMQSRR